jgi:SAM-dependent methyltransferase
MQHTNKDIEVSGFETMAESMEFADNYNNWILHDFKKYMGTSLLEIGTGQGNFKKYVSGSVKSYASIDIDDDVIKRAKERDPQGNYIVADISAADFKEKVKDLKLSSIICLNVLEHVPDHKAGLNYMLDSLEKGGHLLLFVPSFKGLYNDLDRLAGHLRRYKKKDVLELISNRNDIEIIRNEYFNPVGGFGWWLNKFKKHETINSKNVNKQVLFFDKYVVPFSKFFNFFTKPFFGQSLYCIIKKKN